MQTQKEEFDLQNHNKGGVDPLLTRREGIAAEVLFEQLVYLIQFADGERDRLERVKAILLETFN